MEKISLFRPAATMPYAEVTVTDGNYLLIEYYVGPKESATKMDLHMNGDEAKEILKAGLMMIDNFIDGPNEDEE